MLGEHGGQFNHNRSLVEPLLSVPLVFRYPPRVPAGLRIGAPVTTAALMPTILDLAGLAPPDGLQTRSFAPLFDGASEESVRSPLLAECYRDNGGIVAKDFKPRDDFDRLNVRYRSLEEDGFKLVVDSTGKSWLFQPEADPSESRDLSAEHPEMVRRLTESLHLLVEGYGLGELDREVDGDGEEREIDPEVRKRLEALGYVG